jgi:hypothetical protein
MLVPWIKHVSFQVPTAMTVVTVWTLWNRIKLEPIDLITCVANDEGDFERDD